MKLIKKTITGKEVQSNLAEPIKALVQFYYAFNNRDMEVMSSNWHYSNEIAMDSPLGGIQRGWDDIVVAYEQIFLSPADIYMEYYDFTIHETPEMFYTVGSEHAHFQQDDKQVKLEIRTTRVFKRIDGAWKQMHYHGSIDNPKLLENYQSAIIGK